MKQILEIVKDAGFDLAGITGVKLKGKDFEIYRGWVKKGRAGQMTYLERDPNRRRAVTQIMPGAKSVICLGINYFHEREKAPKKPAGQVARYAYGRDYHKVLEKMLKQVVAKLREISPQNEFKTYVDTGAVLEKAYAEQAGLGKIGLNTTLITPEFGSFVFLAEIITDLELEPTKPDLPPVCGGCEACIRTCPTGALLGPRELDARRCISYLTIEHRGAIPLELRQLIGNHLYGCDVCQEICPSNQGWAKTTKNPNFSCKIGGDWQILEEILTIETDEEFNEKFAGSPMRRAKREGLIRNACIVAANIKTRDLLPILKELSHDKNEIIAEHATWAISKL